MIYKLNERETDITKDYDFYWHFPRCFPYALDKVKILQELVDDDNKIFAYNLQKLNIMYQETKEFTTLWKYIFNKYTSKSLWWKDITTYPDILKFLLDNDLLFITDFAQILYHYAFTISTADYYKDLIYEFVGLLNETNKNLAEVKLAICELKKYNKEFEFLYNIKGVV